MTREAIRQNRIDRAQAYYDLVARMSVSILFLYKDFVLLLQRPCTDTTKTL